MQMKNQKKPRYMNMFTLLPKMPITAKVSILHRITGVLLFISIPFILYILHKSITHESFYTLFYSIISSFLIKLIYLVIIFAACYHTCAGIRYLFLDIDKGIEIKKAKITAYIALLVSTTLTIVLGVLIW